MTTAEQAERDHVPRKVCSSPLYSQLSSIFRERIIRDDWHVGMVLPSEVQLSRQYGVSVGTTRKALEELEQSGWVMRQQGRGTLVADAAAHQFERFSRLFSRAGRGSMHASFTQSNLTRETGLATDGEMKRLGLSVPAEVLRVGRVFAGEGGVGVAESYVLRADLFPGLEQRDSLPANLLGVFLKDYAIEVARCVETLRAILASPEQASVLEVETGTALLEISCVIEDSGRRIVGCVDRIVRSDRIDYVAVLS